MSTETGMPRIAPDLVWRLLDDSAVVVSPRSGEVRVLNAMGTTIWQLLVEDRSLPDIEQHLLQHFDVNKDRVHEDLQSFVEELIRRDILVRDETVS